MKNNIKKKLLENKKMYSLALGISALKNSYLADRIWGIKQNKDEIIIKHKGDCRDREIIYNACIDDRENGFFALMRWICISLLYADERGFSPYVNLGKNCRYYDPDITQTDNVFEYYFDPVSDVTFEQCQNAKNIVDFEYKHLKELTATNSYSFQLDKETVEKFSYIWKKYIHLNKRTKDLIDRDLQSIANPNKKTLGIHVRGTDFKMNYNGHPIATTAEQEIDIAKKAIAEYNYEQIFLATDEQQTVDLFKKEFGDIVFSYNDTFRSTDGQAVHDSTDSRAMHHYMLGFEVLRDAISLASCNGLIAGQSNVSFFAMIINQACYEPYYMCHICNNGLNSNTKVYQNRKRK